MVPAPLFVVTAALCTQSGQAVGKFLFGRIDPSGVLALRLGIAAAVLLVIFGRFASHAPAGTARWWPGWESLSRE